MDLLYAWSNCTPCDWDLLFRKEAKSSVTLNRHILWLIYLLETLFEYMYVLMEDFFFQITSAFCREASYFEENIRDYFLIWLKIITSKKILKCFHLDALLQVLQESWESFVSYSLLFCVFPWYFTRFTASYYALLAPSKGEYHRACSLRWKKNPQGFQKNKELNHTPANMQWPFLIELYFVPNWKLTHLCCCVCFC